MNEVDVELRGDILFVRPKPAELSDEDLIRRVGAEMSACVEQVTQGKLMLDLTHVTYMSSLMLGQMALLGKMCRARQVSLKVCSIAPLIKETLLIVGFNMLLDLHDEEAAALTAFAIESSPESAGDDARESDSEIEKRAAGGDAESQFELAQHCENGTSGVAQDFETALRWYQAAADQGHAGAQYTLGDWHAYGINVGQDYEQAIEWYRKAANLGHADAQFSMGMSYSYGLSVDQDDARALEYYLQAADGGNLNAQARLGNIYLEGTGADADPEAAARWFRMAAEAGHADAQYGLGWCFATGTGIGEDAAEADRWYRKAADQGHSDALAALKKPSA